MSSILDDYDPDSVTMARPLLKGLVTCIITEVQDFSQSDPTSPRIEITVQTESPAASVDGAPVNPGLRVTDRINLSPPHDPSKLAVVREMRAKQIKRFKMAALGYSDRQEREYMALPADQRAISNPENWVGKRVQVRFDTRTDRNDSSVLYQDIKSYLPMLS